MGRRNYLVEGVSTAGKTSVCRELQRRGFHAINGDTELAYRGDPASGAPTDDGGDHEHHIWDVDRVRAIAADGAHPVTFFCGGSRNAHRFLEVFDEVFVLVIDTPTLERRLAARQPDEWAGEEGPERELVRRLHATQEDVPAGTRVDATAPLPEVVEELLRRVGLPGHVVQGSYL